MSTNIKSLTDMIKGLTDDQKQLLDKELLDSGGILRDYTNNEVLFPLNVTVYGLLKQMLEEHKKRL